MKQHQLKKLLLASFTGAGIIAATHAATIVVNTVDNTDFSAGKTNLYLAISLANTNGEAANTINFAIPGAGPHYIVTPLFSAPGGVPDLNGGYPYITNHNLTINGYSQAGASANTSTILGSNTATLKIVIDSRAANYTTDANHPLPVGANSLNIKLQPGFNYSSIHYDGNGYAVYDGVQFDASQAAQLMVFGATNVVIKGLCFLNDWFPGASSLNVNSIAYAVNLPGPDGSYPPGGFPAYLFGPQVGYDAAFRVSGCWFNLEPDGATVVDGGANAVVVRSWIPANQPGFSAYYATNVTIGVEKGTLTPQADHNIFMSFGTPVYPDGHYCRVQGNRFNVFPDGLHQYFPDPLGANPSTYVPTLSFISNREGYQTYGTDGDGVNDAEERNIFGGLSRQKDRNQATINQGLGAVNVRISGNYCGVGVDGTTRFTNSTTFVRFSDRPNPAVNCTVGSDFDGVSDALEANVIGNNWPLDFWFTDPVNFPVLFNNDVVWNAAGALPEVINDEAQTGALLISFRGNKLLNNFTPPISPVATATHRSDQNWYFVSYTNVITPWPGTPSANAGMGDGYEGSTNFIAVVNPSSSTRRLKGTFQLGIAPNNNVIFDVYVPNEEGLTNGLKFQTLTNILPAGWVQGEQVLASNLQADAASDLDPATGAFNFNISKYNIPAGTKVTVTASYAAAGSVGTYGAPMMTSRFSQPVALVSAPDITITSIAPSGGNVVINWTGGDAPYIVEKTTDLNSGVWVPVTTTSATSATVPIDSAAAFFRVQ